MAREGLSEFLERVAGSNIELVGLILFGFVLSQSWFKGDYVIGAGDFFPFVFPLEELARSVFVWDYNEFALGLPQYNVGHLAVLLFFSFFSVLGFFLGDIERLWLGVLFVLPAVSMYVLASVVLKEDRIGRFAACFFYMMNVFVVVNIVTIVAMWAYFLIPLLLALLLTGFDCVKRGERIVTHALAFSLATILVSYLSINPALIGVLVLSLGSYVVFHLAFCCDNNTARIASVKFLLLCCFFSVLLNAWWIVPLKFVLFEAPTSVTAETSISTWGWVMGRSQFLHVFQLNSFWSFIKYYYPFANVFSENPFVLVSTFVPSLLVFAALLFADLRKNKFLVYSLVTLVFVLFFLKGIQPPFEGIYTWAYNSIPYFWLFREPAGKFLLIAIGLYAVLIGFSVSRLCKKLEQLKAPQLATRFPLIAALLLFSVSGYVLLTGEVILGQRSELPAMYFRIPEYWHDAAEYVNSQPSDFRVLMLPKNEFYQMKYAWGYYGTDLVPRYFFKKPAILAINVGGYLTNNNSRGFVNAVYDGFYNDPEFPFADALSMMNVKYVIQRNDVDWTRFGSVDLGSQERINGLLQSKREIHLEKTFGNLDVYVNEKKNSGSITVHAHAFYVNGELEDLFYANAKFKGYAPVFLLNGTNEGSEARVASKSSRGVDCIAHECNVKWNEDTVLANPKIKIVKRNQVEYEVLVQNAGGAYWLAFSDSFDQGWTLSREGKKIEDHFVSNGYANAWLVEEKGNYTLSLEYEPQKKISQAYIVSIATFIACMAFIVYSELNRG